MLSRRPWSFFLLASFIAIASLVVTLQVRSETPPTLPEFTQTSADAWINSTPLKREDLLGKVVLLDIWTFDCWNCYRSFPWLKDLEARWQDKGLQVIGIHTPEFEHERIRSNVVNKGLHHPVMMDNDFAYWQALDNKYWPVYYLIDKQGRIRYRAIGETHIGDARAKAMEDAINQLISQP